MLKSSSQMFANYSMDHVWLQNISSESINVKRNIWHLRLTHTNIRIHAHWKYHINANQLIILFWISWFLHMANFDLQSPAVGIVAQIFYKRVFHCTRRKYLLLERYIDREICRRYTSQNEMLTELFIHKYQSWLFNKITLYLLEKDLWFQLR